jgi:hypothetical protein
MRVCGTNGKRLMTVYLSPELEYALFREAERRGITPSALAEELIIAQLPSPAAQGDFSPSPDESPPRTMYDRWKEHLDSLPKPPADAPKTNYSQDTGRRFAEAMVEKRRQGRL